MIVEGHLFPRALPGELQETLMQRSPILLTPGIAGADGLSLLAREVASALAGAEDGPAVEIWSLTDVVLDEARVRSAHGSRLRFASWGAREILDRQEGRTVLALHAHLAPVTLPLVYRGALLYQFLVGIEAWKRLSLLQAAAFKTATRLISISRHSAAEFRKANPTFENAEIAIVHPGLPNQHETSGVIDTRDYALIVGRMSREERYKGHDLLLEIWSEVRRRHPSARLLLAGGGDDRERLESKATRLGLGEAVQFLGHVPEPELTRLYRGCALFVMPSFNEGFGFVFLEAMREGKACIGAPGSAGEIIEDGVTGIIVDPARRDEVTSAIVSLLKDSRLRESMGARGKARFVTHFTRDCFRARLCAVMGKER